MRQKSYDNSPTLYIVPTPIGNIEDITIRGIRILKEVSVIFSEDTRETIKLLNFYDIKNKLLSNHKYNEESTKEKILNFLKEGKNVAIVSDRGTPIINDPGFIPAKHCIDNGYNVVSLPGATAFVPALVMSGIKADNFLYYGFLNSKEEKRKKELEKLSRLKYTMIFYEAPHRLTKTLKNMLNILGDRDISISREISKKFEEVIRGSISQAIEFSEELKGEFVIVVSGNNEEYNFEDLSVIEHVNLYIKEGKSKKDSFKLVAKDRKIPKSSIYKEYLEKGDL